MNGEKVFISWSGEKSRAVGTALKGWLPFVFQGLDVWISDQDLQAGTIWGAELDEVLKRSRFGVICLTRDNLDSHWLTFEAGALSKAIAEARVAPYRFDLRDTEVSPPLSLFQGVDADESGTFKLVRSINDAVGRPLTSEEQLRRVFERWWGDLAAELSEIPTDRSEARLRSDRDVLDEILETVRRSGIRDLNQGLGRLLANPNVLKVELAPKQVAGEVTAQPALRVTVAKKLPLPELDPDDVIPSAIFGMPTDVVASERSSA